MFILLIQITIMAILVIYGLKLAGAIGVGVLSLLGLAVMVFVFQIPLGSAPVIAVMIILSIGVAGGFLEASGGLNYLVYYAGRIIAKKPAAITFIAPLIVFIFVFGIGTSNIALSLEAIIARTALKAGIRPERPLVASATTANMALLCSPAASSALVAFSFLQSFGYTFADYLMIVIPSTLISVVALSAFMCYWGKPLAHDPIYQVRLATGVIEIQDPLDHIKPKFTRQQKGSVAIFLGCVMCILFFGLNASALHAVTRPNILKGAPEYMNATHVVQIFMFLAAALILILTKHSAANLYRSKIFTAAMGAALAVLGPGWLGATIFQSPENAEILSYHMRYLLETSPWILIIVSAIIATFVMSQTAIVTIIYPIALGLGVPAGFMVAIIQIVNTNYFIPAQPVQLFAEEVDLSGTTQKYRFWLPGIFSAAIAILAGLGLWHWVLHGK